MNSRLILVVFLVLLTPKLKGQDSSRTSYFPYQVGDRVAYHVINDNNSGDRIFEYRLDVTGEEPREALVVIGGSYNGFGLFEFYQDSSGNINGRGIFEEFDPWVILDLSKINEINSPWISFKRDQTFELGVVQNKTFEEVFFQEPDTVIGANIFENPDSTSTEGLDRFYQEWSEKYSLLYYFGYDGGATYLIKGLKLGNQFFGDSSSVMTSSELSLEIPKVNSLHQNYPNPFNPSTTVSYSMKDAGTVVLELYDITGRFVEEIVNEYKLSGEYKIHFDASNLSSGTYFIRGKLGESISTQKITLIK